MKSTQKLTVECVKQAHINTVLTKTNNTPTAIEVKEITQTQVVSFTKKKKKKTPKSIVGDIQH